jgi:hypothetical protein
MADALIQPGSGPFAVAFVRCGVRSEVVAERSSTVWMVNPVTGLEGRKGTLNLQNGRLVFRPDSRSFGDSIFALSDIRRARRMRGTPVLEVALRTGPPSLVGFYFVKPPSMEESADFRPFQRRKTRKLALNALRRSNVVKKQDIEGWVEAIRSAQAT